jgi:hypothetical protein
MFICGFIVCELIIYFKQVLDKADPRDDGSIIYRYIYHQSSSFTILIIYGLRTICRFVFLLKNVNTCNMQTFLRKVRESLFDLVEMSFLQEQVRRIIFAAVLFFLSLWGLFINKKEISSFYYLHVSILSINFSIKKFIILIIFFYSFSVLC